MDLSGGQQTCMPWAEYQPALVIPAENLPRYIARPRSWSDGRDEWNLEQRDRPGHCLLKGAPHSLVMAVLRHLNNETPNPEDLGIMAGHILKTF